ncbi:IclR family transcriptional regulator [Sphingomonas sp. PL-96]|uniref:IclR family transcriptional regulator n=1 Tax=Sphingomonas sp. PL-96 TaxID=2887201 RepID=UPI001E2B4D6C|nr:IclR family transcriptional regulator [Sphingomonas sp. PL-96]MCC2975192.1 IclR family transcriptional regulator [Sphingomonas sp. PL-96]
MTTKSRYQAPALKKGLEILELLATAEAGLSMSDISGALGRSVSEIFRMLQVLEEHRYILRDESGFRLTSRLFSLGMRQPPVRDLVSTALPVMQELARNTGQSCHLAVPSGSDMVVIAGIEAPGLIGFAVRIGYRRPLHLSASGRILLAFQPRNARAGMLAEVREAGHVVDEAALFPVLDALAADGGGGAPSPVLNGIMDISVPVLSGYVARAALTIPFVDGPGSRVALAETRAALEAAAAEVSGQLAPSGQPDQLALPQT